MTKVCQNPTAGSSIIPFNGTVQNCGDVTLVSIVVNDNRLGNLPGLPTTLAPGASFTYSRTYTPAAGDCPSTNIVTASGTASGLHYPATPVSMTVTSNPCGVGTVGDGIPDWWRQAYFGGSGTTTNSQSCATCDADGTGQNNLFKYTAGLDPTNPASVFILEIAAVPDQPGQNNLLFGPIAAGRTYTVQSNTDPITGVYTNLTEFTGPQTNAATVTITDTNAEQPVKLYRVNISVP